MKRAFKWIGLMIVLGGAAWPAKAPAPGDFMHQAEIGLESGHAVYEFVLTEAVYRSLKSPDIGDLRVFNARGNSVPHAVQKLPAPRRITTTRLTALPIFPLYGQEDQRIDGLTLRVEKSDKGSIIDLRIDDSAKTEGRDNAPPIAYIADASSLDRGIDHLRINWTTTTNGRIIKMTVAVSQDLEHWHTVAEDAPLAILNFQGHRLVRQTIALKDARAKYLRLTWSKIKDPFHITHVSAVMKDTPESEAIKYKWTRLSGQPDPDQPGAFRYDVGGHLPVHRAHIVLPDKNAAVYTSVFSAARLSQTTSAEQRLLSRRRHSQQPTYWRTRYQGLVYDLEIEGGRLVSGDFSVSPTNDRYWRIALKNPQGTLIGEAPVLELGWVPEKVVFIAHGEPPFRLGYGSHKVKRADFPMIELLNMLSDKEIKPRTANIIDAPYVATGTEPGIVVMNVPLKRWILWGVLALGVGLLCWMAVRLFRQINATGSNEDALR